MIEKKKIKELAIDKKDNRIVSNTSKRKFRLKVKSALQNERDVVEAIDKFQKAQPLIEMQQRYGEASAELRHMINYDMIARNYAKGAGLEADKVLFSEEEVKQKILEEQQQMQEQMQQQMQEQIMQEAQAQQ